MELSAEMEKRIERYEKYFYPYIGISTSVLNQIVLFTAYRAGININGKGWPVGKQTEEWDENSFVPFTGEIKVKNGRVIFSSNYDKDTYRDQ